MNFLIIAENAVYNLGGAEHSLYQYCKKNITSKDKLSIVSASKDYQFLDYGTFVENYNLTLLSTKPFGFFTRLSLLYTQLVILKHFFKIIKLVINHDIILTQNRWAPYINLILLVVRYFEPKAERKIIYFIRDEKCLVYYRCYAYGWRRVAWYFRHVMETPFRLIHKALTKIALKKANVIFNSHFMMNFAESLNFNLTSATVEYPFIEKINKFKCTTWLTTQDQMIKDLYLSRALNVAMVGGEMIKGIEYFEKLSEIYTNLNFVNFSKERTKISKINNVYYFPWQATPGIPYFLAKTLIVPSIWMEAFGRVVVEAKQFECNIIVADKGGLVEALADYENGFVCDSFDGFSNSIIKCVK